MATGAGGLNRTASYAGIGNYALFEVLGLFGTRQTRTDPPQRWRVSLIDTLNCHINLGVFWEMHIPRQLDLTVLNDCFKGRDWHINNIARVQLSASTVS